MNIRVFIKDSPPVEFQDVSMIGYQTEDGTWDELPLVGWTTITADPATLPPDQEVVLLSVWNDKNFGEGKSWVVPGWRRQVWGVYYAILKTGNTEIVGTVYKWQPWPTPPPFPSADEQNEGER